MSGRLPSDTVLQNDDLFEFSREGRLFDITWSDFANNASAGIPRTTQEIVLGLNVVNAQYPVGNVLRYGADPTGAEDSTAAIQAAIDSDCQVYFPPGLYLISSPINITEAKVVHLGTGLIESYDRASEFPSGNTTHARVYATTNINFFNISSRDVYIYGGTYDVRQITGATNHIFHYDFSAKKTEIWGGGLFDINVIGTYAQRGISGGGAIGIYIDLENATDIGGYMTHCTFTGRMQDVSECFHATAMAAGMSMFANSIHVDIDVQGFKTSIWNESFSNSTLRSKMQSMCGNAAADLPLPGIYNRADNCTIAMGVYDFATIVCTDGTYKNNITIDNDSYGTIYDQRYDHFKADQLDNSNYRMPVGDHVYSAIGIIPRSRQGRYINGCVISDLHNQLIGVQQRNTVVVETYKGDTVSDFLLLTDDSATEGISVSTDLTLSNGDEIFSMESVNPSVTANATAVADADYIEIYIDATSGGAIDIDKVWFVLARQKVGLSKIQYISKNISGTVIDNFVIDLDDDVPGFQQHLEVIAADLTSGAAYEVIIRFIGLLTPSLNMTIHDVGGIGNLNEGELPYLHTQGGQTIRGDIVMAANVDFTGLPTSDPASAGRLWNDTGTLKVSAG